MSTKFLKIKSTGTLSSKELDCAVLRFPNSDKPLNFISVPAIIDTGAEFRKHLLVLDCGGEDISSNKVICFNFGPANRVDAVTHAQLFTGYSNKTIIHKRITGGASIIDTTVFNLILDFIEGDLEDILIAENLDKSVLFQKRQITTTDRVLVAWNANQTGNDIDRPKWLFVSTDNLSNPVLANNALITTSGGTSGQGTVNFLETEQFDESVPTGGATYYLNANKTSVGFGTGVKDQITYADDATGTWYSDKKNDVVYVKCDTTFIIQNGSNTGNVDNVSAEQFVRDVNSLKTFEFNISSSKLDSKFFDEVENDGLFPGGASGFPTDLRNDFLGNRDKVPVNTLTPALVNAGTATNAATGETSHIANKVNLSYIKTSKAIKEIALGLQSGGQNHILTY